MHLTFDTETSGKANFKKPFDDPSQPHLVQLGAVLTDDNGIDRCTLDVIIKPDGFVISEEVSAIHGITHAMAEDLGVPLIAALSIFNSMLRSVKGGHLVAHNIDFDLLILQAAHHRIGKPHSFGTAVPFCTMHATTALCKLPQPWGGYKWPKLTEAHRHIFGTDVEGAHNAIVDVLACKRIYEHLQSK